MSERFTGSVALIAVAGVLAASSLGAQIPEEPLIRPKTPFDQLFKDYAAGDFDVITRKLKTGRDRQALQPPADAAHLRKWLGTWDRAKAAFILEVAEAETDIAPGAAITSVSEGRLFVISRPTPLGQSSDDDAFELAWHKGAMALLEDRMFVPTQELYLDTLQRRYSPVSGSAAIKIDPRFALERGVAQEQKCWNDGTQATTSGAIAGLPSLSSTGAGDVTVQGTGSMMDPGQLRPGGGSLEYQTARSCLSEALKRYLVASADPETASEALTRTAWMEYKLGAPADALKILERAKPIDDVEVTYWMHLFRGRMLDALGRFADAESAYRAALTARPAAQSAAVGLALTLFKLDRVADARAAAAEARQQPTDTIDPWWTYLGADARFIPHWRTELRRAIQPK